MILAVGRLKWTVKNKMINKKGRDTHIILLVERCLIEGTENLIQKSECALCPDNEATEVSTRSKLKEIQPLHVNELDARNVPECLDDSVVLVVNNKGASTLTVATITKLALSGTKFARV